MPLLRFQALLVPPALLALLLQFPALPVPKEAKGLLARQALPVPRPRFPAQRVPPAPSRQLPALPVPPALPLLLELASKATAIPATEQQQRLLQPAELPRCLFLFWKMVFRKFQHLITRFRLAMWFLALLLLAVLESISGFSTGIRALLVPQAHLEPAPRVLPVPKALQVRFLGPPVQPVPKVMSEPQALPVLPLPLLVPRVPPAQPGAEVHP